MRMGQEHIFEPLDIMGLHEFKESIPRTTSFREMAIHQHPFVNRQAKEDSIPMATSKDMDLDGDIVRIRRNGGL